MSYFIIYIVFVPYICIMYCYYVLNYFWYLLLYIIVFKLLGPYTFKTQIRIEPNTFKAQIPIYLNLIYNPWPNRNLSPIGCNYPNTLFSPLKQNPISLKPYPIHQAQLPNLAQNIPKLTLSPSFLNKPSPN